MAKKTKENVPQQKIRIKLRAYDYRLIDKAAKQIIDTVLRTGGRVSGPIPLPTERTLYTVLRSTFIHKNSQEQYEIKVHKRLIDVIEPTSKTIDALGNLNLPAGVDIEIKMI